MSPPVADAIRIDKLLWFLRLTKTRSLAQAIVAEGHIRASGRVVDRAHYMIRAGDVLTFPLNGRVRIIRLETLPARRGPPAEAHACYTDLAALAEPAAPPAN